MWEDDTNKNGGRWLITLANNFFRKSDVDNLWLDVILCLIGEGFEYSEDICGAVVNIRPRGHKICEYLRQCQNIFFFWLILTHSVILSRLHKKHKQPSGHRAMLKIKYWASDGSWRKASISHHRLISISNFIRIRHSNRATRVPHTPYKVFKLVSIKFASSSFHRCCVARHQQTNKPTNNNKWIAAPPCVFRCKFSPSPPTSLLWNMFSLFLFFLQIIIIISLFLWLIAKDVHSLVAGAFISINGKKNKFKFKTKN